MQVLERSDKHMTNDEFLKRVQRYYEVKEDDRKLRIYLPISDPEERDILHNKDVLLYKSTGDNYYDDLKAWLSNFDVKAKSEASWQVNPEYWLEKLLTPDLHDKAFSGWKQQVQELFDNIS
jgi:general stress protein 26